MKGLKCKEKRPSSNVVSSKQDFDPGITDNDLIEEVRNGSQAAFRVLMKRYERPVYRIGFSYSWLNEHAMVIAQTVFLKLYQKLDLFRGSGS